jgi:glycolate oxidase iron-sulfur subunit
MYGALFDVFEILAAAGEVASVQRLLDAMGRVPPPPRVPSIWSTSAIDGFCYAAGLGDLTRGQPSLDDRVRAARISLLAKDISQIIAAEAPALEKLLGTRKLRGAVAFHSPCSLQHGQQIRGVVEGLLQKAGYQLTRVADAHLCCGSAGTYSILQPDLSLQLRARKIAALEAGRPAEIATANIGCLAHLQPATQRPVRHWIELLDEALRE